MEIRHVVCSDDCTQCEYSHLTTLIKRCDKYLGSLDNASVFGSKTFLQVEGISNVVRRQQNT